MPGDVENSLLLQAVTESNPDLKPMPPPPNAKLSAQQIADLTQWIKIGRPWPGQEKTVASTSTIRRGKFEITDKDRAHWAFQPVKRPDRTRRQEHGLGRQPHRRLHSCQTGGEKTAT